MRPCFAIKASTKKLIYSTYSLKTQLNLSMVLSYEEQKYRKFWSQTHWLTGTVTWKLWPLLLPCNLSSPVCFNPLTHFYASVNTQYWLEFRNKLLSTRRNSMVIQEQKKTAASKKHKNLQSFHMTFCTQGIQKNWHLNCLCTCADSPQHTCNEIHHVTP